MKMLGPTLYVEFSDLQRCGVSEAYLWKVCSTARSENAQAWANVPNVDRKPGEGKVLIQYDTIPAATRAKLPARGQLLQQAADAQNGAKRDKLEQTIRGLLPAVPAKDLATLKGYRIKRETTDLSTGEVQQLELSGLPEDKLLAAGLACRWLALLGDKRWKNKAERLRVSPAFDKLKDLQDAIVAVYAGDKVDLPTSPSKVAAKLRAYAEQGALAVVPQWYANDNSRKVKEEQLEFMIKLFANPRKPSFELVHGWYMEAVENRRTLGLEAWPEIEVGTVKNNLMELDVQPVWWMGRNGFESWKNKYEYTALRYRPTFRDALWVVDGTKVNYYYRKPGGKKGDYWAKLQVVAVIDAATDYWLGWTFCEQEDYTSVGKSLRMALRTSGQVMPWQVQYDNDASNKKFFAGWAGLHFPAMPRNGQSKIIEQAFGKLQQNVMRRHEAFTGQNLTASSLNGKANPESLAQLLKEGKLLNLDETMREAAMDFHIWNETPSKRDGKTPRQRYEESQHPATPTQWSEENTLDAFGVWNERPIRYNRNGLVMQQGRERANFEVLDSVTGGPDMGFHSRQVGQSFWVKYDPEQQPVTSVGLYVEVGTTRRFVAWAETKQALPMAVADYQEGDRNRIQTVLEAKKTQRAETAGRLENITERLDAEEMAKLGYSYINKDVLNAAEAAYRASDERDQVTVAVPVVDAPLRTLRVTDETSQKVQAHYLNLTFNED